MTISGFFGLEFGCVHPVYSKSIGVLGNIHLERAALSLITDFACIHTGLQSGMVSKQEDHIRLMNLRTMADYSIKLRSCITIL
uniref:Uncharacterized protein n=1 Tax=Megaselia scalaris TaxID=36166 RepID=T1H5B4_MEGSC